MVLGDSNLSELLEGRRRSTIVASAQLARKIKGTSAVVFLVHFNHLKQPRGRRGVWQCG